MSERDPRFLALMAAQKESEAQEQFNNWARSQVEREVLWLVEDWYHAQDARTRAREAKALRAKYEELAAVKAAASETWAPLYAEATRLYDVWSAAGRPVALDEVSA